MGQPGLDAPQATAPQEVEDREGAAGKDGEATTCYLSREQTLQLSSQIQQVSNRVHTSRLYGARQSGSVVDVRSSPLDIIMTV